MTVQENNDNSSSTLKNNDYFNSECDTKQSDDHLIKNNTETKNKYTTISSLEEHDTNYEITNTSWENNNQFEIAILNNQQLEIKHISL